MMRLGRVEFAVVRAVFRPVENGLQLPLWDLNVYGHCVRAEDRPDFPIGLMLSALAVPLPLSTTDDLTGFGFRTPRAAYPESGQSAFALWADGEYETWDLDMRLDAREGETYRLGFEATTSYSGDERYERLRIDTRIEAVSRWDERRREYPMWLLPGTR